MKNIFILTPFLLHSDELIMKPNQTKKDFPGGSENIRIQTFIIISSWYNVTIEMWRFRQIYNTHRKLSENKHAYDFSFYDMKTNNDPFIKVHYADMIGTLKTSQNICQELNV